MKKIYYLAGLPRTGNTLLGSILNQNPKIKVSPNSILVELVWRLHNIKKDKLFLNIPDHQTVDNIIKKTFEHYYDNTDAEFIFDRGPLHPFLLSYSNKPFLNAWVEID